MARPLRGEVWNVRFDPAEGAEIQKVRPAVVRGTPYLILAFVDDLAYVDAHGHPSDGRAVAAWQVEIWGYCLMPNPGTVSCGKGGSLRSSWMNLTCWLRHGTW